MRINPKQHQAWTIAIIIALLAGGYFLRYYVGIIILAVIAAFIFNPVHQWFLRRYKRTGISASLTFVVSLLVIIIPAALVVLVCYLQIKSLINDLSNGSTIDIGSIGQSIIDSINRFLSGIPGAHQITTADVVNTINTSLSKIASGFVNFISSSIGSISRIITSFIIYVYIFVNILMHQDELLRVVRGLNPLGDKMSDLYLQKMGSMTKAMAVGQVIIAILQGTESALVLYIAGLHSLFFFFIIVLSFLSIIPLGAGIVTIPIGIVMILTGNIWQGVSVIANHLIVVTNIDNVIRPKLVPKDARLNSALTILGVFAGVAVFGFLGIIVGPVIMVVLVTTIQTYLRLKAEEAKGD